MSDDSRMQMRAFAILIGLAILLSGFLLWGQFRSRLRANLWNVRFLQAEAKVTELPELNPGLSWWQQVWLGQAALERNDLTAARELLAGLETNPSPFAIAALGELSAAEGDHPRAIAIWSGEGNYQALVQAAEAAEQTGEYPQSEAYYLAAYQLAPAEIILALSSLYTEKLNQPEKAIPILEKTILQFSEDERWSVWQRLLGDACRKQQDWDCAEQAYQQALSVTPDDVLSLVGLGYAARDGARDPATALDYFSQAIERQPGQYEGYLALAEAYTAQGEWQNADPAYLQAINVRPDLVGLYVARARSAQKSGNLALARQVFTETQILFPESDMLDYEFSALEYQAGNLAAARALIEQALQKMQPPQHWFYRQAGIIYAGQKDYSLAQGVLMQGLESFPQEAGLYIELAIVEKGLNHPEQAVQAVEQALALTNPPNASYLARAGVIYEWVGDSVRALNAYRQALQLDPADPVALPGFQRLEGK